MDTRVSENSAVMRAMRKLEDALQNKGSSQSLKKNKYRGLSLYELIESAADNDACAESENMIVDDSDNEIPPMVPEERSTYPHPMYSPFEGLQFRQLPSPSNPEPMAVDEKHGDNRRALKRASQDDRDELRGKRFRRAHPSDSDMEVEDSQDPGKDEGFFDI